MSDVLNTKALKVLFSRGGAPKWVIEPGANSDKDAMQVVVRKGQAVEWKRHGDTTLFTIRFDDPAIGTPFSDWAGLSRTSTGGPQNIVAGTVSESDNLDVVYKYNIEAVGQVTLDPAIIIDK
jgi:hypothetical protein